MTITQAPPPAGEGLQVADVKHGFTRRCGKLDPVDKSPCMHAYGHEGQHAWEPAYIPRATSKLTIA